MTNRQAILSALLMAACAVSSHAAQPGLIRQGSTTGGDGWKLSYSAVAKPPLAPGQHFGIQTGASHTEVPGGPPVFHRFFADPVNRTYFGYDVVVDVKVSAGKTNPAAVKFQPLSLRGDQLPSEYGAADFHSAAIPRFPTETFQAGQTIAVDVLKNPATGLRVVDYIQVTLEPAGPSRDKVTAAAPGSVAKTIGNPGAPVCIEMFSDFQCPACKVFHDILLPLILQDYVISGKAYVLSHEFPLTIHPHSRVAANYATAAAHVGKYQAVADALFRNQQEWGATGKVWDAVASVLTGEEQQNVQALANDPTILTQVQQDVDLALAQQVRQTPTLFVSRGPKRYAFPGPSPDNYALLKSLIDQLLK